MAVALSPDRAWQRLRWEWQRQRLRLPWMAGLTMALLLAAVLAGLAAWQGWSEQAVPDVVQAVPRPQAPVLTPEAQARADLDHFYQGLPPARSLSVPLMALLRLGDKHGVHFNQGEYHNLAEADTRLVREDIVLPAEASPADMQAFLHDAMQSIRALTVTGIAYERDDVKAMTVKARIHLVLVARAS